MSTITLSNPGGFNLFTDLISLPIKAGKSVSSFITVYKITTDKKNLKITESILKDLEGLIEGLPKEEKDLDLEVLKHQLEITKQNQLEFNKFFDTVDSLFDLPNTIIDDPLMMQFYSNMQKAKEYLSYIADYINLVFEVKAAKESTKILNQGYSYDEFTNLVNSNMI